MPTDPTPLAQRLVDAASDAFDVGTFNFDAVVVAVLRGLAEEVDRQQRMWHSTRLRALADSIEKGAE